MSRGQENQVFNTASSQTATAANNAQTSFNNAQSDVGNYEKQLAEFAAANPYGAGGAYQTAQNQVLSNTADAAGRAAGQAMQSQAVRTGVNAGGAVAGTEASEQANERNLASQEAQANQQRITQGAQYGQQVLSASAVPEQMEANLSGQQLGAQEGALGNEQKAAATPSTADAIFGDVLQAGQAAAGAYGAVSHCWIAARLFGGWNDRRTKLLRRWIFGPFAETWYGIVPAALYARFGETVAERWMPKSRALTWVLRKIFEAALRQAESWNAAAETVGRFEAIRKAVR